MDSAEGPVTGTEELIEAHYLKRFGNPWRRALYRTGDTRIQILAWTPKQTDEEVYIFATIGAYARMGDPTSTCEFFLGLTGCPEGLAESLAEVALDGIGTGGVPASGDTLTLAIPLWQSIAAQTYMFTDGGDAIIPPLEAKETRVEFIQLVPLFRQEAAFKTKFGEAALWEAFEQAAIPYWDPGRAPLARPATQYE